MVCNHLGAYLQFDVPWIGRLGGLLGVELFFIVSGFLIARSCAALPPTTYLARRMFRIFPVYWVVVLGLTVTGPVADRLLTVSGADWLAFALNFLALSHFYPPALAGFDVTTVSWSLTVELIWYGLAPLLALAWWMRPGARAPGAVLATAAAAAVVSIGWVWLAQGGAFDAFFRDWLWGGRVAEMTDFHRYAYLVNAAPAHWSFFVLGAALAAIAPNRPLPAAQRWLAWAAIVITLPMADRLNALLHLNPSPVPALGLGALFLLVFRLDPAVVGAGLRAWGLAALIAWAGGGLMRLVDRLGRISYPMYLIHVPVMLGLKSQWPAVFGSNVTSLALVAVLLAWVLSECLHRMVERPGIRLGRRLAPRER